MGIKTTSEDRFRLQDELERLARGPLMRGSVVHRLRRCGKPNCACAKDDGARHPGLFFTVSLDGKTSAIHVRPEDEARIRRAVASYERLWEIVTDLTRLELNDLRRQSSRRRRVR